MTGTQNRIPYDQIPDAVMYILNRKGRTVEDLEGERGSRYVVAPAQLGSKNVAVWHRKRQLDESVAQILKLHPDVWGPARHSNDFSNATSQYLSKLRKNGTIADLNPGKRYGIFRLVRSSPLAQDMPKMSYERRFTTSSSTSGTEPASEVEMRQAFLSILTMGVKDNTYKFALARAILDHCRESQGMENSLDIPYESLSDKFLQYYWHQECRFRIKQDFHTKSMPKVIQVIRGVFGQNTPGRFDLLDDADVAKAKKQILKTVFGHARNKTSMVVPRFQKVRVGSRSEERRVFYDYSDDTKIIRLRPEAFEFFRNNHGILMGTVLAEWTRFLERTNIGLPMLLAKIHMDEASRGPLTKYKNLFLRHTGHCFYCGSRLEKNYTHVDHFIPWSYIFDDNVWNLVPACQDCNCKKSNSLPQDEFLQSLIRRNDKYYDTIAPLRRSLKMLDARHGWKPEIENHYKTCLYYGFNIISMP